MRDKIVLLSLQTFSATGGIQKMTRTLAYCLQDIAARHNFVFNLWSVYDCDEHLMPHYLPSGNFKGFKGSRLKFIIESIKLGRQCNTVILSHINMAVVGLAIKIINPRCKVMLIAHGIEVWRPLTLIKKAFLKNCFKIVCVSEFTHAQVIKWHNTAADQCVVINNAIDPFMKLPVDFTKPGDMLTRYGLTNENKILFTLTRLANSEQYKGYDQVIKSLNTLKQTFPTIKYILAGRFDDEEKQRIDRFIAKYDAADMVIMPGFVKEFELTEHFLMADLFVLPSKKEGFGIVFIESLACGLPVICGNKDGSLDAVKHGELGEAIDPDDEQQIQLAILKHLQNALSARERSELQKKCLGYFNSNNYVHEFEKLIIQ